MALIRDIHDMLGLSTNPRILLFIAAEAATAPTTAAGGAYGPALFVARRFDPDCRAVADASATARPDAVTDVRSGGDPDLWMSVVTNRLV